LFLSVLEVNSHFYGLLILCEYTLNTGRFGCQLEYDDREYS